MLLAFSRYPRTTRPTDISRMLDIDKAAPDFARLVSADAPLDRIYHGMSFGEGPLWNRRDGTFLWVDIVGDTIHRWKPGVGAEVFIRPSTKANGLTFDKEGRLCVAGWASRSGWRGGVGRPPPRPATAPPPTRHGRAHAPGRGHAPHPPLATARA